MYKPVRAIEVRIWGMRVGALALDPTYRYYAFEYEPSFVQTGIELAPLAMPLLKAQASFLFPDLPEKTFLRLPALIADSLPDHFGNLLIDAWMAERGVTKSQITPLDRLAYMGRRGMGALEFRPERSPAADSTTALELASLVETARRAIRGDLQKATKANAALTQLIRVGTSAGGARAKGVIAWNARKKKIRSGQFDVEPGYEHWLIKFDGLDADGSLGLPKHQGRIEYAYHKMALAAGITMFPCSLLEENGRAHFLTKRFDREGNQKHHLQTLGAMAHMDLKQTDAYSYHQWFMTIDELGLGYPEMEEAFRRMAFNVMAANCDDHPKNFAFLLRKGGAWELAPAYDITYAYNPDSQWNSQHFLAVNGKFKEIQREDLLAVANLFHIGTAPDVLEKVAAAVAQWKDFAAQAGVPDADAERIAGSLCIL
jgi:serine/threonine-protein kinase HipA